MKQQTFQTIFNFREESLKPLNDMLRWLFDKVQGGIAMKDMNGTVRTIINGKADDKEIRSVIQQSADEIMMEVAKPADAVDTGSDGGVRVRITKDSFSVDIPGTDGDFELNESGGKLPVLVSDDVQAPNVTPRYAGASTLYVDPNASGTQIAQGNYFRSLADALAQLSYKWIAGNVTVNLAAGVVEYGNLTLKGTAGGGWVTIKGNSSKHAKLVGKLQILQCGDATTVSNLDIDSPVNAVGIDVSGGYADISNCIITGKGTAGTVDGATNSSSVGIRAMQGARVLVSACELYDTYRSLFVQTMGSLSASNCKGNCRVGANRTQMFVSGTAPCDQTTWTYAEVESGKVWAASGVKVDQGSAVTPETEPTTVKYTMVHSDSYCGGWGYFSDNDIRQGCINSAGNRIRGCMWFDNAAIRSALTGKSIQQATLSLYAAPNTGRGVAVSVELYGTAAAYDGHLGASPELTKAYGTIGTAAPGETTVITIPTQAVSDLVSGTTNGLMVYSDDAELYKDRSYSRNYAKFSGETEGTNVPVLTVVYK